MNDTECIFCRILRGEQEADFIYQDETLVAFKDIKPAAPVHILIVPRKHIRSINELGKEDSAIVSDMIQRARLLADETGIARSGYKLLFNVERGGGQYVFHLHLHLFGGWK